MFNPRVGMDGITFSHLAGHGRKRVRRNHVGDPAISSPDREELLCQAPTLSFSLPSQAAFYVSGACRRAKVDSTNINLCQTPDPCLFPKLCLRIIFDFLVEVYLLKLFPKYVGGLNLACDNWILRA